MLVLTNSGNSSTHQSNGAAAVGGDVVSKHGIHWHPELAIYIHGQKDLDIVMVVQSSEEVFARRAARWDTTELPVPADLLVYTREEWQNLDRAGRFYREVAKKTVWVWSSP